MKKVWLGIAKRAHGFKLRRNKKLLTAASVLLVIALTSAVVHAWTASPRGSVRAVVAFLGDSNIIRGASQIDGDTNTPDLSYVPIIEAMGASSIRWDGCWSLNDCPNPNDANFWQTRIADLTNRGIKPDAYVIDLGINDSDHTGTLTTPGYSFYPAKISWLMSQIPSSTPVFWTNLPCAIEDPSRQPGCQAVNGALAGAHKVWPNIHVLNWAGVANPHPEWMIFKGAVHYNDAGLQAWADFVTKALNVQFP